MLTAAIETGDDKEIATVAKFARATHPDDGEEIDAMLKRHRAAKAELVAKRKREMQEAGFFEHWSGEGELGAFRSTGNSDDTGLAVGVKLTKDAVRWRYKFRARADYQRSDGETTREQLRVAIEPNYKFTSRFYAYGLAQFERDRPQGYKARYSLSGGLGYTAIDSKAVKLDLNAGPAWRRTDFVAGPAEASLAGLASLSFRWNVSDNMTLTQDADAYLESGNNSLAATTALDARLIGALSARLSYTVEIESDPPVGRVGTDTLSRATLVYDF